MASRSTSERIGERGIPDFLKLALLRLWYLSRHHSLCLSVGLQLDAYYHFGKGVMLGVGAHASHSSVGDHSYLARGASLFYANIGKYCAIGNEAMVGLARYPTCGYVSTYPGSFSSSSNSASAGYYAGDSLFNETLMTLVGSDVWIGA